MQKEEYKKLVSKHTPKEPKMKNIAISFFVGGLIGFFAEFLVYIITESTGLSVSDSLVIVALLVILITSILTALGFFDNWVSNCKCGLIIPTTGFAHSVASSAIDYRRDGMITGLGANFFKLAGSVILYGVITSFILVIVRVVIGG